MQVNNLSDIYPRYSLPDKGGDKGTQHSYIELYERYIPPTARSLLEVGVFKGHSLAMWQHYLPAARVVGVDVHTDGVQFVVDARKANATSAAELDAVLGSETFEYVIDDGSHKAADQITTFELLWHRTVRTYFIEDVAGDTALQQLLQFLKSQAVNYEVHDLRKRKNRFDDILIVVTK